MEKNTVCLVVIVYNNENTILQLLQSVQQLCDYYVIYDNAGGSTDNTKNIIDQFQEDHPDKLIAYNYYNKPFHSGDKRTAAISIAHDLVKTGWMADVDYLLIMDADNTLEAVPEPIGDNKAMFVNLTAQSYLITKKSGSIKYPIVSLLRADLQWKYTGVIHEYPELATGEPFEQLLLPGVVIHEPVKEIGEGAGQRSRLHYYRHALLLEDQLINNLQLTPFLQFRYMFYLAQSYRDCGMIERAIDAYKSRCNMGGWDEEVFYSLLSIARLTGDLVDAIRAWEYRPQRLEAALHLMHCYIALKFHSAAYSVGWLSRDRPCNDMLFIEHETYTKLFPELMAGLQEKINLQV